MTARPTGPGGSVEVRNEEGPPVSTSDRFTGGEALADQSGNDDVLDFTFSADVDLLWVRVDGGDGRADPFGGVPAADTGIFCEDGIPNPLTVTVDTVKVWAPTGSVVRVWGYRY